MNRTIEAIYENGVLRPLEPLDLEEQEHVSVTISDDIEEPEWLDVEFLREIADEADDSISLEEVRKAMSKIPGSLTADCIAERDERVK